MTVSATGIRRWNLPTLVAAEVTKLELILQEAAEGTEELICPLITSLR